jgi:hypothetical protein
MFSSRRLALLLTLALAAVTAALAQSSTSSSNPAPPEQAPAAQAQGPTQGQLSVQARIRARRAQRRAAAIHEAYANRYDAYFGLGYLRFEPGAKLERTHEYAWNVGVTRYKDERLGITVDGRGYTGSAYVYNNKVTNSSITNPTISQYSALAGPTYRFYLQPKYSIGIRALGGFSYGNFSGDLGGNKPKAFGLWPDGNTFAASVSLPVEYNLTPHVGVRVAPEYYFTGFGSTTQYTRGFSAGIVYRFGKQ